MLYNKLSSGIILLTPKYGIHLLKYGIHMLKYGIHVMKCGILILLLS